MNRKVYTIHDKETKDLVGIYSTKKLAEENISASEYVDCFTLNPGCPPRSGGRPALNREKLLKKAIVLRVLYPEGTSTLRLDSLVTQAEADKVFNEKMKRGGRDEKNY